MPCLQECRGWRGRAGLHLASALAVRQADVLVEAVLVLHGHVGVAGAVRALHLLVDHSEVFDEGEGVLVANQDDRALANPCARLAGGRCCVGAARHDEQSERHRG